MDQSECDGSVLTVSPSPLEICALDVAPGALRGLLVTVL
jgi:hypothetical protein